MTVIAYDGNLLVADGRCTVDAILATDKMIKIRPVKHPEWGNIVMAFAGRLSIVGPWIEHIAENGFAAFETPETTFPGEFDTAAIAVLPDGKAFEVETNGLWILADNPTAIGSGFPVAQHYLNQGVDALTAVREAIKSNVSCGGQIIAYDASTGKFRQYVR